MLVLCVKVNCAQEYTFKHVVKVNCAQEYTFKHVVKVICAQEYTFKHDVKVKLRRSTPLSMLYNYEALNNYKYMYTYVGRVYLYL